MFGVQAVGWALWKDLRGAGARDQPSGVPGEACLHCSHVSISLQTLTLASFLSTRLQVDILEFERMTDCSEIHFKEPLSPDIHLQDKKPVWPVVFPWDPGCGWPWAGV